MPGVPGEAVVGGWVAAPGLQTQNYMGILPEEEVAISSTMTSWPSPGAAWKQGWSPC